MAKLQPRSGSDYRIVGRALRLPRDSESSASNEEGKDGCSEQSMPTLTAGDAPALQSRRQGSLRLQSVCHRARRSRST